MENPAGLSDGALQEILEHSHGSQGQKVLIQEEQKARLNKRIAELEADLQIAEAVRVRYEIDATGYKAERDKLLATCRARNAIIHDYARHSYGCPAGGSGNNDCICDYGKRMAALGEGGGEMTIQTVCNRCGKEMSPSTALETNVGDWHICPNCLIGINGFILCTHEPNSIKNTIPCKECEGKGFTYVK